MAGAAHRALLLPEAALRGALWGVADEPQPSAATHPATRALVPALQGAPAYLTPLSRHPAGRRAAAQVAAHGRRRLGRGRAVRGGQCGAVICALTKDDTVAEARPAAGGALQLEGAFHAQWAPPSPLTQGVGRMLVRWEVRTVQLTLDQSRWAGGLTRARGSGEAPQCAPDMGNPGPSLLCTGREGAADLRPVEGGPLWRAGRAVAGLQHRWARLRASAVVQRLLLGGRNAALAHDGAAAHARITAAAAARPVPYDPAVGGGLV